MDASIKYPIRYVARQTGLKPYLIRTWEERYGAVRPERTPTNRRLYTEADIQRLFLLKSAVDNGHAISAVAPLSNRDLRELLARRHGGRHWEDGGKTPVSEPAAATPPDDGGRRVQAALEHILQLDANGLEGILSEAAVEMPRQAFLQQFILPLFKKIGTLWQDGKLKIVNEHMASVTVRAVLWDMLRTVETTETSPRIIVATPVGHWHEFGALASALAASESGWKAIYFGPNLPSEEIAYAVRKLNARALCLSLCHRLDDRKLTVELMNLRRSVGAKMPLFIGGAGAAAAAQSIRQISGVLVNDLGIFRRRLEELNQYL